MTSDFSIKPGEPLKIARQLAGDEGIEAESEFCGREIRAITDKQTALHFKIEQKMQELTNARTNSLFEAPHEKKSSLLIEKTTQEIQVLQTQWNGLAKEKQKLRDKLTVLADCISPTTSKPRIPEIQSKIAGMGARLVEFSSRLALFEREHMTANIARIDEGLDQLTLILDLRKDLEQLLQDPKLVATNKTPSDRSNLFDLKAINHDISQLEAKTLLIIKNKKSNFETLLSEARADRENNSNPRHFDQVVKSFSNAIRRLTHFEEKLKNGGVINDSDLPPTRTRR